MFATRNGAVRLSLIVIFGLVGIKLAVAAITSSLSIFAQAADSVFDLLALAITAFAIRIADKPADMDHPFGHGKVENIAAIVQAVLIFTTAGIIIYTAIDRIISGKVITLSEAGIIVMLVSILVSIFLSRHLHRVAEDVDSMSLDSMAHNIATDVYSAAAVLVGMLIIRFFGINILDPIIALIVSLIIIRVGYGVSKRAFAGLIDVKLPEEEEREIKATILGHQDRIIDFHKLRTRKSGTQRYIDLHVVTSKHLRLEEAHQLCDRLEQEIGDKLADASLTIHVEPCDEKCAWCSITCEFRKENHHSRP
ncbi:cation diffusion facilitator family transporter [Chloroflexota bacterium]